MTREEIIAKLKDNAAAIRNRLRHGYHRVDQQSSGASLQTTSRR
jgi:uncharacterized protein YutE (UPF0331/DUF86 family)